MRRDTSPWRLQVHSGPAAGRSFDLKPGPQVIGRDLEADIRIPDPNLDLRHAQLTVEKKGCWMADLGSTTGTYINGVLLAASQWLLPNDTVQMGASTFVVLSDVPVKLKKRRRRPITCLTLIGLALLVLILGAFGAATGADYLIRRGTVTPRELLAATGLAAGEISFLNLSDGDLTASLMRLDKRPSQAESVKQLELPPFSHDGYGALQAGTYLLQIASELSNPTGSTCTLTINPSDVVQFVALTKTVIVTRRGGLVETGSELHMTDSPLCQP